VPENADLEIETEKINLEKTVQLVLEFLEKEKFLN